MSELTWVPWAVAIGGLLGGLLYGWIRVPPLSDEARSQRLLRRDLEERRDDLYYQLRNEELEPADRKQLALSAARILKQLDGLTDVSPAPKRGKKPSKAAASASTGTFRHPLLAGFGLGGGMVGLVALLIFFAQRDEGPRPPTFDPQAPPPSAAAAPDAQGAQGRDFRGQPDLPPGVAAEVEGLRAQLRQNPDNQAASRRLLNLLVENQRLFDAFGEAQSILERDPNDTEALFVSGLVRYTMGMADESLSLLGKALVVDPAHSQSGLVKGLIELQLDQRDQAIATWQSVLDAGGQDERVVQVLTLAREGRSIQEIMNSPP